jgi:hypothetical protein
MLKFLKAVGAILTSFAIVTLVIAAALIFLAVGDTAPGWIVGVGLVLIPFLVWVYRQLRKIDW